MLTQQEFVASRAGQLITAGRYEEAAQELEKMKQEYPQNVMVLRYLGVAYHHAGLYAKALESFKEALEVDPVNVATHYYLAETYFDVTDTRRAGKEYEFVVAHDELGRYGEAAQARIEELAEVVPLVPTIVRKPTKRWELSLDAGYHYDDNATFNPRDPRLSDTKDRNAGNYTSSLTASYEFLRRGKWIGKGQYSYSQSLYDDGLNTLNTYVNGLGLSFIHAGKLFGKSLILRSSEDFSHIVLKDQYFAHVNTLSQAVIYQPHARYQAVAIYNFKRSEFDDDSSDPDVSSRDAFTHNVVLLHSIFFNKTRTFKFTFGYDYQYDMAHGKNFIRHVHGFRTIMHIPILFGLEGEFSVRYRNDQRPEYVVDTSDGGRRDDIWELTPSLERKFGKKKNVKLRGFFTYHRAFGRNNNFEYRRPYGGGSVSWDF